MPTNLELKAKIASMPRALGIAKKIARTGATLLQTDMYFRVRNGRLKLRECLGASPELIYYERNEKKGDRWSTYHSYPLMRKHGLREILEKSIGKRVLVKKKRRLYFYKNARIHLDTVSSLGLFVEFEVVVRKERKQAKSVLAELVELFKIRDADLIRSSYADLIEKRL